jgi:hypothetical protein
LILLVESAKEFQCNHPGLRPYDSVPLPILAAQIALHRPQNIRIVINR